MMFALNVEQDNVLRTSMTTLLFLLLALSPFVMSDSGYPNDFVSAL